MSWKTDLVKSVNRIDKSTEVTATKVDILIGDFKEHKYGESEWRNKIEETVKTCPESGHIELQNGKLDRVEEKLDKMWKRLRFLVFSVIGFICTIIGGIAAWKEIHG